MLKIITLLGTPAAPDVLESKIRICDATATVYRKALASTRDASRSHGES